ncbi:MAG TPA: tripartite tricarboxylate transporter substrate binding protein [Xanthobacteraceae bacterium]|nr:tripartite tricarboxylate transporter substrate binding protein [Xanthobacteraceae bacterium]
MKFKVMPQGWRLALGAAFVLVAATSHPGVAQDYPSRAMHIVTSSPPGGGGDVLVRFVAQKLSALSGQSVVVENKPGAGGNIATDYVVNAKPDGYVMLAAPSSTVIANRFVIKDTRYDALRDLTAVAPFLQVGNALVVGTKVSAGNVKDFVEELRRLSRPILYGVPTASSLATAQMFLSMTGLKGTQVAYKSMVDAASGVAANELDFAFIDTTLAAGQAKQGRMKILAVSPAKRLASAPDLPTIAESGIGKFDYINFWAVWMPAKAPADAVQKVAGWLNQIAGDPATKQFFVNQGSEALQGTPQELTARMKEHHEQWLEIVKAAKIEPQ